MTGSAVKVIDQVGLASAGVPILAVSRSGSVAYTSGTTGSKLVWVSRQGAEHPITDADRQYAFPRVAPDGRHVLVSASGDLWLKDLQRPTFAKLTTDATTGNSHPVWTPNGKRIGFRTNVGVYWMDSDGSGRSQAIPETSAAD